MKLKRTKIGNERKQREYKRINCLKVKCTFLVCLSENLHISKYQMKKKISLKKNIYNLCVFAYSQKMTDTSFTDLRNWNPEAKKLNVLLCSHFCCSNGSYITSIFSYFNISLFFLTFNT